MMYRCHVCGCGASHERCVREVYRVDGRPVIVEAIPAVVCDRCTDATFTSETTERVRRMVREDTRPNRSINVHVFASA
jgi:HTH-type transcriptional regulator / antitoxin MqsA